MSIESPDNGSREVGTNLQNRPEVAYDEDISERGTKARLRQPRLPGFQYLGRQAYHLTLVTRRRLPIMTERLAETVCSCAVSTSASARFELLAYCVMPDHCHLLVRGHDDASDLLRFVKSFKQTTSFTARRDFGLKLWQQSFHDRILRGNEDVATVATYIIENPVDAGLVDGATLWPFSGGTIVASSRSEQRDGPKGSSLLGER